MISATHLAAFRNPTLAPVHDMDLVRQAEVDQLAAALASRFEELTLIHGLTQQLANDFTLTQSSSEVARSLLEQLSPCIASSTLAIQLAAGPAAVDQDEEIFELVGQHVSAQLLNAIVLSARLRSRRQTGDARGVALVNELVVGELAVDDPTIASGETLRVAVVPIRRGDTVLGQMIAIRHSHEAEFGSIEADMMLSTSMMLAAHVLNQRQYHQLQNMFQGMIQSLASALDAKDAYTCGHSNRVAELSYQLASRLGYDDAQLANIRMGGILHDIGKIGVDDSVLRKTSQLTDQEFEQIKRHPVLGYEILKGIEQFSGILPAVRHHHERCDGTGYPDGLAGHEIPRDAQIMAVADAFDAMTSDRPYRSGMPIETVKAIFRDGRGTQWAADVVDVLLNSPELMQG
ncbi:HD-GYP domain-containing protein [Stieleria sp. TO1_6]|uniref:HD-GYP domain-containing protein n=1 Tax=Stieleria tagensis TaxID=2956795 RepID=UPI00209B494D|nr:HD-GYP domain-containing protein [Stieleria tagensis]MCO8121206.1 HD-GYP domain-containing protein [Stieleria tagensis]